jgi:hypothetical protein
MTIGCSATHATFAATQKMRNATMTVVDCSPKEECSKCGEYRDMYGYCANDDCDCDRDDSDSDDDASNSSDSDNTEDADCDINSDSGMKMKT